MNLFAILHDDRNRDYTVGVLTDWAGSRVLSLLHSTQSSSGTHPACAMRNGGSSQEVKRLGREAVLLPSYSADVQMRGALPSLPLLNHGLVLIYT